MTMSMQAPMLPGTGAPPPQPPQETPLDGYFANLEPEKLIGELRTREKNQWTSLNNRGVPTLWRLIYAQAFGIDPNTSRNSTQRLEFCGPQAQYVRFRMQLTRMHIKQRNTLAAGQRPSFNCVASNDDASALASTPIAGKVLTYVFREAKGEQALYGGLDADGYFGEGFVWMRWDDQGGDVQQIDIQEPVNDQFTGKPLIDPQTGQQVTKPAKKAQRTGAPKYKRLFPWNVIRDTAEEDPSWYIVRERASKAELMARFPEHADRIQNMNLKRETEPGLLEQFAWDLSSATDDLVLVKHFYHRNSAAVPGGRYVGYVEDLPLWDVPCPLESGMPLVSICSARYFDTPIGYPEASDLLSQQEMLDELLSQAATNILKFGNQNIWGQDGVEFDEVKFMQGGNYFTLKENQQPPQVIQWAELPDATKYLLEYLPNSMGKTSGMNPTVLGTPETNITSGVFASLMQATAEKFVSATQAAFDFAVTELGNMTLEFIRTNGDVSFEAEVSGDANLPYMRFFSSNDFQGIRRVQVTRQSPVLNNIGGRFEVFQATVNLPKDQRQAAMQLLTTGDPSAYMEHDMSALILIRKENEQLALGQEMEVSMTDDHLLHCGGTNGHRFALDRLRTQDPPKDPNELAQWNLGKQTLAAHINNHAGIWQNTNPVLAAVCGIPAPPMMDPMTGQMVPHQLPTAGGGPQMGGQQPAPGGSGAMKAAPKPAPQIPGQPQTAPQNGAQTPRRATGNPKGVPSP